MIHPIDAATDGILLTLKRIATRGGERGPFYDQGVLEVIRRVEQDGRFERDPIFGLLSLFEIQSNTGSQYLEDKELAHVRQFLEEKRWAFEQAFQYAGGVYDAQNHLLHFGPDPE